METSPADTPRPPRPLASRLAGLASALVILLVLVVILRSLASFLQPLFVAIFFYYIGVPLSRRLRRLGAPEPVANASIVLLGTAVLLVLGGLVAVHVDDIRDSVPAYSRDLRDRAVEWIDDYSEAEPTAAKLLRDNVVAMLGPTGVTGKAVGAVLGGFVGSLQMGLFIVVFLVFLTFEGASLPRRLKAAFGEGRAAEILEIGRNTNTAIIRYVYVKGLMSALVAGLSTGVFLAVRLDMALLWGALTFFGNFIPYVGSAVAVALPSTIALLQFGTPGAALGIAAVLLLFQILVAQFIEPRFAGRELNLSPIVVILSIAFWGWCWGVIGLLLAMPVMVAIRLAIENVPGMHPIAVLLSERPRRSRRPEDQQEEAEPPTPLSAAE
jgi:predicted PurR-regulated permease PerM